ncbi:MAG: hypothetical protein ACRCXZ_02410, partial [Patescibacteria group bacterium]
TVKRFKLPNFKFPLSNEEMIVICFSAFVNYPMRFITQPITIVILNIVMLILGVWSYSILSGYTVKEKLSINGENNYKFFSQNFVSDLIACVIGVSMGFGLCCLFQPIQVSLFVIHLLTSIGIRCFARYFYSSSFWNF